MKEIRFHGRGGQGIVKAAHIIVRAVVESGDYSQFVPFFGVERKGSPVFGFLRINDSAITLKTQVYTPDLLMVLDESLLDMPETFTGFKEGGTIIVNTKFSPEELTFPVKPGRVATVDATHIALEEIQHDIPNTSMLGAFCRVTGWADWEIIQKLITEVFGNANTIAAKRGYDSVSILSEGGR